MGMKKGQKLIPIRWQNDQESRADETENQGLYLLSNYIYFILSPAPNITK